ncbi:MAG: hypothetical protein V1897_12715 [Pseudomonadota bacterium]
MGYYIHNTPGRLRLKIPQLKRNMMLADEISLTLREKTGVQSVEINTLTGSLKVNFNHSIVSSNSLLNSLSQEGYIDLSKMISSKQHMDSIFSDAGKVASKALFSLAIDKAFEGSSLSLLAAFI